MAIARVEPLTSARALRGPFDYRLPPHMEEVGVGSLLIVPFGRRRVLGVVVELASAPTVDPARLVEPVAALEAGTPADLMRLGLWVGREYCSTPARGLALVLPPGANTLRAGPQALKRLERRGHLGSSEAESRRPSPARAIGARVGTVKLNAGQREAVGRVEATLDGHGSRELLVWGITGSGKTEVYLAAADAALERGRDAIVLVPEIGLAPQTVYRFRARLGDRVAVLHSAMGAAERAREWRRLDRGEAQVAVGPRSAVFAPLGRLGLIVVDEEHEASYKQEADPRYDAREVARRRAAQAGAVLLAGSATPRPESWHSLERVELHGRATGAPLPAVEILDMRGRPGDAGVLHDRTRRALARLERDGGKAIVLATRRGVAPQLACRACGGAWSCSECDVSLVLHGSPPALRCHHCGRSEPVPSACRDCGSVSIARVGAGTQQVEAAIAEATGVPVFRLDSDAASRRGAHAEILEEFDRARAAVLVGTQMVAKGHDFPDVVLAVVVDADATLRFPDFRADERTFALVTQLAGRSGRADRAGQVLVQTLAPETRAIAAAARQDAPGFLAGELERRRALRYPPFSHLARVELGARDEDRVEAAADQLGELLANALPGTAELLGPAPLFRRRGRHRRQLLLKGSDRRELADPIRAAIEAAGAARLLGGVTVAADLDPE